MTHTGAEKRQYKRVRGYCILKHNIPGDDEQMPTNLAITRNIGAGGVYFCSDKEIKLNSLLDLHIDFPATKTPIKCNGKVVRVNESKKDSIFNIAAVFTDINDKDKEAINTYAEDFYRQNFDPVIV